MISLKHILLYSLLLSACGSQATENEKTATEAVPKEVPQASQSLVEKFFHPDRKITAAVDSIYKTMSNRERAAQMIMTASSTAEKLGYPYATAKAMVTDDVAANIVFLKGKSTEFESQVNELNTYKTRKNKLKPLFACDCEPSLIPYKWTDVKDIKAASLQKDIASVEENTDKINEVVKRVGVQLNFAPVVDIAANKSVINNRSFGSDAAIITELSRQFVTTTQDAGLGATLKHFPGHGAVKGDSHKQSVFIDGPLTELNTFKDIIQSKASPVSVMVGHIVVKNNTRYSTNGLPATLSRTIVTDLLRKELKFEGIITTDALNMEAAAKVPDADWKSVQAGVDLVLMPKNAAALNKKIEDALGHNDDLSKQIETSVKRVIRLKVALGM